MGKLSKHEINAIANKLRRELEERIRLKRLRAIYEYIPSPDYSFVEGAYKRIRHLNNQINDLYAEKCENEKKIQHILNKTLGFGANVHNEDNLTKIIEAEINLPKIPSLEEIKDNMIIEAIDSEFDVEDYLRSQLEKY